MDPDGAMENAKSGVSHSSLDGANSGAAHRSHRPGDEDETGLKQPEERGIFR